MNLLYKSTRNADKTVTASEAILKGLADDGGLFVPVAVPKLDVTMDELKSMSYQETAYEVMKKFLTDFTEEELKHCINSAYDSKFDTEVIAPLVKVGDTYHLELFHDGAEGQGGQIGHGLALQFLDLETLPLHHFHRFSGVFQHIFHIVVLDGHCLCHNSSLLAVIQSDDRGGRDGDIHSDHFVYAASCGIHGKLSLEGKLSVRSCGGNRATGFCAAKPHSIIRFRTLFCFQSLVIGQ